MDKSTDRVLVAILGLHDNAVHLPEGDEKEAAKDWVGDATCPEWRDGFLLGDGSKVPLYQQPGLHGDAWFDKDKEYSMDVQVCFLLINKSMTLNSDRSLPCRTIS